MRLLDVQVVTIEEVSVGGAADIDAGVVGSSPEDQQAEETDGESTPQGAAVRDTVRVQQLVAMVISQGSGLLGVVQMFPEEPNNRSDLKHTENSMTKIYLLAAVNVVQLINTINQYHTQILRLKPLILFLFFCFSQLY